MTAPARGAEPRGAADEHSASKAVQSMFDGIAPRYDLLNHVLSANIDRRMVAPNRPHLRAHPEATRSGRFGCMLRHGRHDHGFAAAPSSAC